ncbi:hypothetical protein F383_35019 [Gossypium arboreum]|uniref:Uncharacterized protein n=1 Tax=Gossypium arboreum TaxID=29729 RepID=A0A0B0N0K5_GOSAR|nr:hypothetical protein F383_35019 [Gossypium arboreum]
MRFPAPILQQSPFSKIPLAAQTLF